MLAKHKTSQCRFKFNRPCNGCSGAHFNFLCLKKSNNKQRKSTDQAERIVSSNLAVGSYRVLSTASDENSVVMPTFTCTLPSGIKLRAVRDTGSQCNFVSTAVAEQEGFKILSRDLRINVSGFKHVEKRILRIRLK